MRRVGQSRAAVSRLGKLVQRHEPRCHVCGRGVWSHRWRDTMHDKHGWLCYRCWKKRKGNDV